MISKEERAELRLELSNASLNFPLPWRLEPADIVDDDGDGAERYIVAAANAAPKLLEALDAAERRITELEGTVGELEKRDDHLTLELASAFHNLATNIVEAIGHAVLQGRVLDGAKARIVELEDAAQWRTMDTVPMDGTHVVVYMGFRDGAPHFETRRYIAPPLLGRSTHWRWLAIPAPPKREA